MNSGTVCGPSFDQGKATLCLGSLLKRDGSVGLRVRDMVSTNRSSILEDGSLEASISLRMAMDSGVGSNEFMRSCCSRLPALSLFAQACVCCIAFWS